MTNKVLKIEADLTPTNSPKLVRELKRVRETFTQTFDPKMMEKFNKQTDNHIKHLVRVQKLTKEQGAAYKEFIIKPLKEQETLYKSIEAHTKRSRIMFDNAERMADRYYQRRMAGVDPNRNPNVAAMYREEADQRYARIRAKARGDMNQGQAFDDERMQNLMDARQERAAAIAAKVMSAGAVIRAGSQGVKTFGDLYYGQSLREAQYKAGGASFAGYMYDKSLSGDYTSLHGILNQKGGMAKFRELVADQRSASKTGLAGDIGSGFGSALIGTAQAGLSIAAVLGGAKAGAMLGAGLGPLGAVAGGLGGAAVGGLGAWALGQGLSGMVGGTHQGGLAIQQIRAGKIDADASEAAIQGAEFIKRQDPIGLRKLEALQGKISGISDIGSIMRVSNPYTTMSTIGRQGESGGMDFDQSMQTMYALRSRTNDKFALANVGTVARAPQELGISQQGMMAGIAGMSGLSTGPAGSVGAIHDVLRKAMSEGIKDSQLKEAIVEKLPAALAQNAGGRAGGTSNMEAAIEIAQKVGKFNGRQEASLEDMMLAMQTVKSGDRATTGNPSNPLFMDIQNRVRGVLRKAGIRGNDALEIAGTGFESIDSESTRKQITDALQRSGKLKAGESLSPEAMNQILTDMRVQHKAAVKAGAARYNMSTSTYLSASTGDRAGTAWFENLDPTVKVGGPASKDGKDLGTKPMSPEATEALQTQILKVKQMNDAIMGALGDPKMHEGLQKTVQITSSMQTMLNGISATDIEKLKEVGEILSKLGTSFSGQPADPATPSR